MLRIKFKTIAGLVLALTALACGQAFEPGPQANPIPKTELPKTELPKTETPAQRIIRGFAARMNNPAGFPSQLRSRPTQVSPNRPTVHLPEIGDHALFSTSGNVAAQGNTAAGSATYTGAPVLDPSANQPPTTLGTGSFDVTVAGTQYTNSAAESFAYTALDSTNNVEYLVIGTWSSTIDPVTQAETADVVYTVVPSSDYAAGASVVLDGVDRLAVFFHGDTAFPDPQVAAVAETGTVSFGQGSLAIGGTVDATLAGDFVEVVINPSGPSPTPTPSGSPSPTPVPVTNLVAGPYNLHYLAPAQVYCDGTLAGQETAFAALVPADFGLADGPISIAISASFEVEVLGVAGFSAAPLYLGSDPQAPPGLLFGMIPGTGTGPLSTSVMGLAFALDDSTASATHDDADAAVALLTADEQGFCQVDFVAELTP